MSVLPVPLPSDRAERLARALRIQRHGLIRPLWEDMDDYQRWVLTAAATDLIEHLARHGITIANIEEEPHQ